MKTASTLRISVHAVAAMAMVGALSLVASAQATDPLIGTWKVNLAKSTYSPSQAPKSSTAMFAASGSGLKVVVDAVASTGDKTHIEYTAQYDGKDYKMTGNPDGDMISMKRTSARVTESTYKMNGKPTITNTRSVSADGKTLTVTSKGTNAKGQTVNNVQVFDKG